MLAPRAPSFQSTTSILPPGLAVWWDSLALSRKPPPGLTVGKDTRATPRALLLAIGVPPRPPGPHQILQNWARGSWKLNSTHLKSTQEREHEPRSREGRPPAVFAVVLRPSQTQREAIPSCRELHRGSCLSFRMRRARALLCLLSLAVLLRPDSACAGCGGGPKCGGGPRPGCLRDAYECDVLRGQCGVYIYCDNDAKAVNCQTCGAPPTVSSAPSSYCNYTYGRCLPNPNPKSGPGAICGGSTKTVCATGWTCRADVSTAAYRSSTGKRCCRTTCPKGAWGGGFGFKWRNECGTVIQCSWKRT